MPTLTHGRDKADDSSTYLRVDKPLKASRGLFPRRETVYRVLVVSGLVVLGGLVLWVAGNWLVGSRPFRIDPELAAVSIDGIDVLAEEEVRLVFADDAGRSLAAVDIGARLNQLEAMPWVRSARVARVWPNAIAVTIEERRPVAFLEMPGTSAVRMIDSEGVVLDLRRAAARPFPLLTGVRTEMAERERRKRVALFERVMEVFEERGEEIGQTVSEVDVSDATNAVVLAKHQDQVIQLQMGDQHLRHRLDVFLSYIEVWRSEFGPLQSVDLRFDKQVTVKPATDEGGNA